MTWHRYCYWFPSWPKGHSRHKDGYARGHWMSDRAACQALVDDVIERGGKGFVEDKP